jgi:hypothetical protein
VAPNSLRYAAPTGRVRIRWDGARQPVVWTVPAPPSDPAECRLELARRHLRVMGPSTPDSFSDWAGVKAPRARRAFEALGPELVSVRTPVGDAWILAADEPSFTAPSASGSGVRLLPGGDTLFLLQGRDRELLVPDAGQRGWLWTPRVWPGALLIDGEVAGTWRRADWLLTVDPWRALSSAERAAVEAEAASLPLPGLARPVEVRWPG